MIDEENKGFEIFSEIVEFCIEFWNFCTSTELEHCPFWMRKCATGLCCSAIYLVRTERRKQVNHWSIVNYCDF